VAVRVPTTNEMARTSLAPNLFTPSRNFWCSSSDQYRVCDPGDGCWRGAGFDCEKPAMISLSRCACGCGKHVSSMHMFLSGSMRGESKASRVCLLAGGARPRLCGGEQGGGGGGVGAHLHGGDMQLLLEHKVLPREVHERVIRDRAASVGALALGGCLLFQVEGQPRRVSVRRLQVAELLRAAWCGHAEGKVSLVHGAFVRRLGRAPAIGKRRHQVGVRLRHLRACVLPHLHRVVREVVLHRGPRCCGACVLAAGLSVVRAGRQAGGRMEDARNAVVRLAVGEFDVWFFAMCRYVP